MARIPEPQPKSITVLPCRSRPSSQVRHREVVGWVPVPKARPGSSMTLTAFGSGTSRQLGQIHNRSPKRIGWKLSIHSRSQSLSSICSILWRKPLSSSGCWLNSATTSAISVSASNRPITSVTDTAPASISASLSVSAWAPAGQQGIAACAHNHAAERAAGIGALPIETQHQRPQKYRFKPAKCQQIEPDNHIGRIPRRQHQQCPQRKGRSQRRAVAAR
ncbi:hypothetical protein COLO4_02445 [Corchorus olitorius]|uniref:Uncharacterized protein n=1 Tax=Corchorus olitorius TaxID=93759 RepID=A0A1R3L0Y2_9ROSI|nr:hypothetical protein COLO4_02445 [Corchorus olitorius]